MSRSAAPLQGTLELAGCSLTVLPYFSTGGRVSGRPATGLDIPRCLSRLEGETMRR
jgi:hypothetical protein